MSLGVILTHTPITGTLLIVSLVQTLLSVEDTSYVPLPWVTLLSAFSMYSLRFVEGCSGCVRSFCRLFCVRVCSILAQHTLASLRSFFSANVGEIYFGQFFSYATSALFITQSYRISNAFAAIDIDKLCVTYFLILLADYLRNYPWRVDAGRACLCILVSILLTRLYTGTTLFTIFLSWALFSVEDQHESMFLRTVSRCMGNIGYFVLFPIRLLGLMITRNPLKDCTESLENETEIRERNLLSDSASGAKEYVPNRDSSPGSKFLPHFFTVEIFDLKKPSEAT